MDWSMLSSLGAVIAAAVAAWQLYLNRMNSRKESFQSTFNALLEQHFNAHTNIQNYIKYIKNIYKEEELKKSGYSDAPKLLSSIDNDLCKLLKYYNIINDGKREYVIKGSVYYIVNVVRDNSNLSPYFRQIYHIIKLIDEDDYFKSYDIGKIQKNIISIFPDFIVGCFNSFNVKANNRKLLEKKKYTNILRSYIDDEVLLLIAINALKVNDNNSDMHNSDYLKYRNLLVRFDFLQHLRLLSWYKDDKGNNYRQIHNSINYIEYIRNCCDTLCSMELEQKKQIVSIYQFVYFYEFANYIYGKRNIFKKKLIIDHVIDILPNFSKEFTVDISEMENKISGLIDDINNKKI